MARAKAKQYYYYVLVFTTGGAVYVTDWTTYPHKEARWDKTKTPKEMTREDARYMALGLSCNGTPAQMVASAYELDTQPYNYDEGGFVWKWNEEEEGGETK